MNKWRILDTGIHTAAENIALDAAILKAKNTSDIPNTVRFLQFSPPAVLLGFHQSMEQEIRIEFCKNSQIDVNRRITGGGTIFFDTSQLGWEIICDKDFFQMNIADINFFKTLSQPLISSLYKLGIEASFRPRNDVEINGKKISGTGGTEEGNVFLFQGTLLTDFDIKTMIKALRIPVVKLKDKEINEAKERVTCLKWELQDMPSIPKLKSLLKKQFEEEWNIVLKPGELTEIERNIFNNILNSYQSQKWINKISYPKNEQPMIQSIYKAEGGIIRTSLVVNQRFNRIQSVIITGDFFAYPKRTILNLEAELKDIPTDISFINNKITNFFKRNKPRIPGIESCDFVKAIDKALEKFQILRYGIPLSSTNRIFTVNNSFSNIIQNSPNHLLLPYCSKSLECGYRYKKDCVVCGNCSISDAFELGREKNMIITTILSFEDLMDTLDEFKKQEIDSYIGCCCEAFFIKHIEDFEKSKIPGILLDINNITCYDLGKEKLAYLGKFEHQTDLDIDLLKLVLNAI